MTVIAWDGNTLAADGRSTCGSILVRNDINKIRTFSHPKYGEMIGAFTGTVGVFEPWIDHIKDHGFTKFDLGNGCDATALMITPDGVCLEVHSDGMWTTETNPVAQGSGYTIAQHYLNNGTSALDAVRETIKSNITCGGHIITWNRHTKRFRRYAR